MVARPAASPDSWPNCKVLAPLVAALALAVGCSTDPGAGPSAAGDRVAAVAPPAARPGAADAVGRRAAGCPVTVNNTRVAPPGERPRRPGAANSYYTTGELWVALWPRGVTRAGPPAADGSLAMKLPWWRGVRGRLRISGRRLDAPARPLRAHVPAGYGLTGFQSSRLDFPSPGCWQVRATVGRASLVFVTLVPEPGSATTGVRRRGERGALPLRDCGSRAEGPEPTDPLAGPEDVVVGPIVFAGLGRVASQRGLEHFADARGYGVKAGALLRAGVAATLFVAPEARRWAALEFAPRGPGRGEPLARWAVRFRACPADEPAFSHPGPVGSRTAFAGGFVVKRPGCMPLEVQVASRPPVRARVPFGVGRC